MDRCTRPAAPSPGQPARIGVIGDVHACDERLADVLDFFSDQQLDLLVCVGDIITGAGSPDRCAALLADANVLTVRGNHDRWLLEGMPPVGTDDHRIEQLAPATVDFLRSLPASAHLHAVNRIELLLCHGVADNDMNQICADDFGYALEANDDLQQLLAAGRPLLVVKGHRHRPAIWSVGPLTLIDVGTLLDETGPCAAIIDAHAATVSPLVFSDRGVRPVEDSARALFAESR